MIDTWARYSFRCTCCNCKQARGKTRVYYPYYLDIRQSICKIVRWEWVKMRMCRPRPLTAEKMVDDSPGPCNNLALCYQFVHLKFALNFYQISLILMAKLGNLAFRLRHFKILQITNFVERKSKLCASICHEIFREIAPINFQVEILSMLGSLRLCVVEPTWFPISWLLHVGRSEVYLAKWTFTAVTPVAASTSQIMFNRTSLEQLQRVKESPESRFHGWNF